MARFVHYAPEHDIARIRRTGLRSSRDGQGRNCGVYAMPVVPDFLRTHQWLREIKRWHGGQTMLAVYFHIDDGTPVHFGHYNSRKSSGTARDAVACLMQTSEPLGFEAVIGEPVAARQVKAIRFVPQMVGWRYFPGSNGRPPFCTCDYCQKGQPFSRRLRGG